MISITFSELNTTAAEALLNCYKQSDTADVSTPVQAKPENVVPAQPQMPAAVPTAAPIVPTGAVAASLSIPTPAPVQPVVPTVPVVPVAAAPTYDIEMLGRAAAPLAAQGKQQELLALLQSFGVQALTQLPPDKYGEMAMKLRGLGAQI